MAKRKSTESLSGATFADLYDAQEEMGRRMLKPMGRPRNKVQRRPTTVHLTKEELRMLRRLHLIVSEHVSSMNRSQIMGMAIELVSEMVAAHNDDDMLFEGARNAEAIKNRLKSVMLD